jgi:hypothetical protein
MFSVPIEKYLDQRQGRGDVARLARDVDKGADQPGRSSEELNKLRAQVKRSSRKILKDDSLLARPLPGKNKRQS